MIMIYDCVNKLLKKLNMNCAIVKNYRWKESIFYCQGRSVRGGWGGWVGGCYTPPVLGRWSVKRDIGR